MVGATRGTAKSEAFHARTTPAIERPGTAVVSSGQPRVPSRWEPKLDRTYRKALYKLLREVTDVADLDARFDAFIEDVRRAPADQRPYPDQVRDTLRGLSLRRDLALRLQERYEAARVGAARESA